MWPGTHQVQPPTPTKSYPHSGSPLGLECGILFVRRCSLNDVRIKYFFPMFILSQTKYSDARRVQQGLGSRRYNIHVHPYVRFTKKTRQPGRVFKRKIFIICHQSEISSEFSPVRVFKITRWPACLPIMENAVSTFIIIETVPICGSRTWTTSVHELLTMCFATAQVA